MTFRIRAARDSDLQHLYEMAKLTGGGFTNLPADRRALEAKLDRCRDAFARDGEGVTDELFVLILENAETGEVRGTCQIFTQVGQRHPFYSYRMGVLTQHSQVLDRTFRAEMLSLTTDLEGSSEVGGLFLHPGERAGGLGMLLARSRYLFIAMHRARFADRTIAELRGVVDDAGDAPFWDGIAARFFGMSFAAADAFNADHGTHVLAGLLPTTPVLLAMLPEPARAVLGVPHPSGRPALRLLEKEGFRYDQYVDLFDGGPTVTAATDDIATVRNARTAIVRGVSERDDATPCIAAAGRLAAFRACFRALVVEENGVVIDPAAARALGVAIGDPIIFAPR